MKLFKNRILWLGIGALLLTITSSVLSYKMARAEIDEEKLTYDELSEEIEILEKEKLEVDKELTDVKSELKNKSDELNIALDLINGIGEKEEEFEKLEKEIKDKKEERDDIKKEVKQSEKKLDIIEAGITEAKKKPIELSSGQYKVGADLDEGRYKATNVGRGSNFVVHNSSGRLKVNTILGNDGFGSGDYVFYADDGDSIQTESQVKLIPIE